MSIPTFNCQKTTQHTLFCLTFSLPCHSSLLSSRFGGVLGGITEPRTTFTCFSPMGLLGRHSGVYHAKNGLNIGLIDPSVGFFDPLRSWCDQSCFVTSNMLALAGVWLNSASIVSDMYAFMFVNLMNCNVCELYRDSLL